MACEGDRIKRNLVTDVVDKYYIMLSSSYWGSRMERERDKQQDNVVPYLIKISIIIMQIIWVIVLI